MAHYALLEHSTTDGPRIDRSRGTRLHDLVVPLLWVGGAALTAHLVAAVFAGMLEFERNLYLLVYFVAILVVLVTYVRLNTVGLLAFVRENWKWGILGGVVAGYIIVHATLLQSAPRSPMPTGAKLVFAIIWLGLVYGALDGFLLSVLPVHAVSRATANLGWSRTLSGRVSIGMLALVASMFVTAVYHLGYPEFRSPRVLVVVASVTIQSLAYVLTRSPIAPLISHVAMHVTAVLYGIETFAQLPPHY